MGKRAKFCAAASPNVSTIFFFFDEDVTDLFKLSHCVCIARKCLHHSAIVMDEMLFVC